MRQLFRMECKKIVRSILYWLYAAALTVTVARNYEMAVESELGRRDDPASVFYMAEGGIYADRAEWTEKGSSYADESEEAAGNDIRENVADGLGESARRTMMTEATKRLLSNYRSNRYEYYPFGYVKEKRLSEKGQAAILSYLKELTGLDEASIMGTEIQISGGGAFVLNPGQGGTFEGGRFVTEPGDWEYVENPSRSSGHMESSSGLTENAGDSSMPSARPETEWEVQVSFDRFREIMEEVNNLIGRGSYFSWTMLTMYYCENDMQDAPITERQHREFYEKDRVTGAFARYYCDSISLVVLCLPALVIMDLWLRDRRCRMRALLYPLRAGSVKIICARLGAAVAMCILPVLILPVKSLVTLALYCRGIGVSADITAFAVYAFTWIFPTVLLVSSIALLVTVLTESYFAVLAAGLLWLFGRPAIDKLAGGNYGLFDLIIRHNTLKGYGRMMENIGMLVWNRAFVSAAALALAGLAVLVYSAKRKGGIRLEGRKSADDYYRKHPHVW